jgi:serine phosphatase RsbU (regulator of sigma subunit)
MDSPEHLHLRLHAVNVYVRDQDRSLRFYLDQLGFNLAFDGRLGSGERWVAVSPPDGSAVIRLIAPSRESPQHKLIGRATQIVLLTEDVVAKYFEWSKRGVRFRNTPRLKRVKYENPVAVAGSSGAAAVPQQENAWGAVFTRFEDIDGNSFSLVGFDEFTRQLEEQRRTYAEKLEADRRAARELEIARQVQARLFPQALPPLETLEYTGTCVQARQVGGDYYDFLDLGQRRLGLVIGDIAGKGIAGALLMANLQANLRSQCAIALDDPVRFLRSVNQLFYENSIDSAYATLFYAEYDDTEQSLRYSNCGHLPALVLRADCSLERLDSTSTVVGLFKNWACSVQQCSLFEGDTLVLYTDGVTEAFNSDGDEFGEQRLVEALHRHCHLPPHAMVSSVLDDVKHFSAGEQHDDITLMVARCITPRQP